MPELDTLRGVAVLLVVLFHSFGFLYSLQGLSGISKVLVALTKPGWVGVNLFFVLSGFLITGILLDTKSRRDYYGRFYRRRALRILPLYYAVLLLLLVLARTGLVSRHVSWSFLGLSAIYLANVTELFGVPMQYGVLWSLAVEEHFYLLWPKVVRSLSRPQLTVCAGVLAASCLLMRIIYCSAGLPVPGYTWLAADGLALGAMLAAVARTPAQPRTQVRRFTAVALAGSTVLFAAGAPFGIFLARHFLGLTLRDTAINLFFAGIVGLTLLLGSSRLQAWVNVATLQFLGKISYGIYLIHMLVFEAVSHFMQRYFPNMYPAAGHFRVMALQFLTSFPVTIALASLSRWYFEEPFLRLKDKGQATTAAQTLPVSAHDEQEALAPAI